VEVLKKKAKPVMDAEQTEQRRERQFEELKAASTPDERKRIEKGRRDGRHLRREVEKL
jgi:hypothetical protein